MGCSFFVVAPAVLITSGFQPSMAFIWLWRAIKQSARVRRHKGDSASAATEPTLLATLSLFRPKKSFSF